MLARRDRPQPGHVAVTLGRGQVGGDVAHVPGANAGGRVFDGYAKHGHDELLAADEVVEDGVVHVGLSSLVRGLAIVNSVITAPTTSAGEPSRSSTGPHFQPSR